MSIYEIEMPLTMRYTEVKTILPSIESVLPITNYKDQSYMTTAMLDLVVQPMPVNQVTVTYQRVLYSQPATDVCPGLPPVELVVQSMPLGCVSMPYSILH